ncbi:MAG: hypothetical protein Q9M19_05660 [Mariprofundaceae bacterium]|nr:hypothetical protein [Mariprofundaceae bacterium]
MSNIRNPAAAVIVWSYKDRLTHEKSNENTVHEVHETVLSTLTLVSIKTNKSKSSPVGSFTFTLAPYKNWVDFITPGSWCAIMMTNEGLPQMDKHTKKAVQSELKFFGRITSVRGSVHVSPDGARQTLYVCEGEDWGSVFNSVLYVDPAARNPNDGAVGTAVAMLYSDLAKEITEGKTKIPTTTINVKALLNLWGRQSSFVAGALDAVESIPGGGLKDLVIHPNVVFKMPDEAAKFLGINPSIASHILDGGGLVTGVLDSYDKYKETSESVGIIDPSSIFGSHPIWGVIKDNTNEIINELFCDLRWVNGKPKLGLYKRVRPFLTRDAPVPSGSDTSSEVNFTAALNLGASQQQSVSSKFEHVRRVEIPKDDVISFDTGTNWRDKLNFIEILPDASQFQYNGSAYNIDTAAKGLSQVHDRPAFGREGFKGASFTTRFYPVNGDGDPSFQNPQAWARVLAQWYFNSHNYLNGTIEFVGQSEFIGVGDNIMVDASIFGQKPNMNIKQLNSKNKQFFLLHVESLSHSFSVSSEGARHWTTTISYTRGVLADEKGKPTDLTAVDLDTSKLNSSQELNDWNTVATSSGKDGEADPDKQKVPKPKRGK